MRPWLLAAALLTACAPTQRRLLAGRHYEEALRGATKGGIDGGAVLAAIERDLQIGLHLQAVGAGELRSALPGAPPGLDGVVLVRVVHDANLVPIDGLEVSLSLLHRGTLLPPVAADRVTLAALVGETLPQATVTVTPGTVQYKPVGFFELLGRVTLNVITVGLIHDAVPIVPSEIVGGSVDRREPGAAEYRSHSPAAETLFQWLQPPACAGGLGQMCRYHLLWPRPQVGAQDGGAPLELAVSVRVGGLQDAAIVYRLALPAGSLESGLSAMFGDRQRTLADLHRHHGRGRLVVHPLDVLEPAVTGGFTVASRAELERILLGTRKHPGLRSHTGLRFVIDPRTQHQPAELRIFLLSLGVPEQQIEILSLDGPERPGLGGGLRVQYALPLDETAAP
jgi:hypothetical protein